MSVIPFFVRGVEDGEVSQSAVSLFIPSPSGRGDDFPLRQAASFKLGYYRAVPHYSCRSSVRYWMA